jgi:hypothetical protein
MPSTDDISPQEALAREFEQWQKEFYDEVIELFAKGNKERGNAAFATWERRFTRFLSERLPERLEHYQSHKSNNKGAALTNLTVLQNFRRTKGSAVESFIEQCIIDARKGYLDEYLVKSASAVVNHPQDRDREKMPKIFISHSSVDADLAELLVDLLRSAFNLPADDIRCTSVEGHRLPGGADVEDQLRSEILGTKTVIGLISSDSFDSAYVLFELGARWGIQGNLIPLLTPGSETSILKGPISGYNALSCDSNSQLLQLIQDVSQHIEVESEPPNVYQKHIERILRFTARRSADNNLSRPSSSARLVRELDPGTADEIIRQHCIEQWPDDFEMRAHCEEQQRGALEELKQGCPEDIPMEVFQTIREKCQAEWPSDFAMRRYCEGEQVKAYRKLHK